MPARRLLPPRLSRTHATAANRILLARRDQPGIIAALHGLAPASAAARHAAEEIAGDVIALERALEANTRQRASFGELLYTAGLLYWAHYRTEHEHSEEGALCLELSHTCLDQFEAFVVATRETLAVHAAAPAPGAHPPSDPLEIRSPPARRDDDSEVTRYCHTEHERGVVKLQRITEAFKELLAARLEGGSLPSHITLATVLVPYKLIQHSVANQHFRVRAAITGGIGINKPDGTYMSRERVVASA